MPIGARAGAVGDEYVRAVTRHARPLSISIGAATVLLGTFLPWVRLGARSRSSYLLLGLVDRLEFTSGSIESAGVRAWPIVPLLLVASVYAAWLHRPRLSGAIGLVAAVYAGGLAIAVHRAPTRVLAGVDVVIVGGGVLALASLAQLTSPRTVG